MHKWLYTNNAPILYTFIERTGITFKFIQSLFQSFTHSVDKENINASPIFTECRMKQKHCYKCSVIAEMSHESPSK